MIEIPSLVVGVIVGPDLNSFQTLRQQLEEHPDMLRFKNFHILIARFGLERANAQSIEETEHVRQVFLSQRQESICSMRNHIQSAVAEFMNFNPGTIGLILDEDMRLGCVKLVSNLPKEQEIELYEPLTKAWKSGMDAMIGAATGDAQIPTQLTQRGQLSDVRASLESILANTQYENAEPSGITLAEAIRSWPEYHHDVSEMHIEHLHTTIQPPYRTSSNGEKLREMVAGVKRIRYGGAFTRPVLHEALMQRQSSSASLYIRGGNFTVFTPSMLLKAPNTAPLFEGRHCRRSDMLMAISAQKQGYILGNGGPVLHHRRESPSQEPDKLKMDILGHAAVLACLDVNESVASEKFRSALSRRTARVKENLLSISRLCSEMRVTIRKAPPIWHGQFPGELNKLNTELEHLAREAADSGKCLETIDDEQAKQDFSEWMQHSFSNDLKGVHWHLNRR